MVHHVVTPVDAGVRVSEEGGGFLAQIEAETSHECSRLCVIFSLKHNIHLLKSTLNVEAAQDLHRHKKGCKMLIPKCCEPAARSYT